MFRIAHSGVGPFVTVLATWAKAKFGAILWDTITICAVLAKAERVSLIAEILETLALRAFFIRICVRLDCKVDYLVVVWCIKAVVSSIVELNMVARRDL